MASNRLTDLSQLDNLDQAAILEALRSRYSRDEIYVSKSVSSFIYYRITATAQCIYSIVHNTGECLYQS